MRGRGPVSATLYFCGEPANERIAAIVRDNLRPLRIDVTAAPSLDCLQGPDPKAAEADLMLVTRAIPELDPAPFMQAIVGDTEPFGPGGGPVTWDDAEFRQQLDRARRLPPERRLGEYARLERELLPGRLRMRPSRRSSRPSTAPRGWAVRSYRAPTRCWTWPRSARARPASRTATR